MYPSHPKIENNKISDHHVFDDLFGMVTTRPLSKVKLGN